MNYRTLASALATASISLAAAPARADEPAYVGIRTITYAGSGCPAGSVADLVASDGQDLWLAWDDFVAQSGPGVPLTESRKNCQMSIDLDYPDGWTYAVATAAFSGYVSLEDGVTATQSTSYYFQGQAQTAYVSTTFTGPLDQDYQSAATFDPTAQVWAPCGSQRALNLNVQGRVSNAADRSSQGLLTVEAPVSAALGSLQLTWRRCD